MKIESNSGFTLIELMIAAVIVAILAAVALPAYNGQIRKSRRADAVASISQYQQAQERWRANEVTYATQAQATASTTANPAGLGLSSTSTNGYYTIAVTNPTASTYTVTATAVAGTTQANDTGCTVLDVSVANGTVTYTQPACWSK